MKDSKLRAWWSHRQGLDGSVRGQTRSAVAHDAKDRERSVVVDAAAKPLGGLVDLPSHAILDRGQVIGLWEYDVDSSAIVWSTFGRKHDTALDAAVEETQAFVRDQLGDARSFSLDSPKSRAARVASLRRAT